MLFIKENEFFEVDGVKLGTGICESVNGYRLVDGEKLEVISKEMPSAYALNMLGERMTEFLEFHKYRMNLTGVAEDLCETLCLLVDYTDLRDYGNVKGTEVDYIYEDGRFAEYILNKWYAGGKTPKAMIKVMYEVEPDVIDDEEFNNYKLKVNVHDLYAEMIKSDANDTDNINSVVGEITTFIYEILDNILHELGLNDKELDFETGLTLEILV